MGGEFERNDRNVLLESFAMKHITSTEKLQLALDKLGEPLSQYDSWSEDGQPLPDITARTRYFEQLPKALFECSCIERHHMIAPKKISTNVGVDNGDIVLRGEFRFEVLIWLITTHNGLSV